MIYGPLIQSDENGKLQKSVFPPVLSSISTCIIVALIEPRVVSTLATLFEIFTFFQTYIQTERFHPSTSSPLSMYLYKVDDIYL